MTSGTPRGGGLSYVPPPRMQQRTGLIAAAILLTVGASLIVGAVAGQQLQSPVRNTGDTAVGVVSSVEGGRAVIEFGVGDQRFSVTPVPEVTEMSGIDAGSTVTVHFDPADPSATFVDRVDVLEPLTPLLVVGGFLLALGLVFARFPPKSPERPRAS